MGCSNSKTTSALPPTTVTEYPVPVDSDQQQQQEQQHQQQNEVVVAERIVVGRDENNTQTANYTQQQQQQQQLPSYPQQERINRNSSNNSNNNASPVAAVTQNQSPVLQLPTSPTSPIISAVVTNISQQQQNNGYNRSNLEQARYEPIVSTNTKVDPNDVEEEKVQLEPIIPIVYPNDPKFTCSINGRNGYTLSEIYEFGTSRDDILGEGSFGKVYRGKHKFSHLDTTTTTTTTVHETISAEDEDDDDDVDQQQDPTVAEKKLFMFGNRTSSSSTSATATSATATDPTGASRTAVLSSTTSSASNNNTNKQAGVEYVAPSRKSLQRVRRQQIHDEWKQSVAIKTTKPTALDTRGGRTIRTYDDIENYCSEVRMLLRLRGSNTFDSRCLFLFEYFYTPQTNDIQLVTELLGQELDQWRQSHTSFMEKDAMAAAKSILKAIDYIHTKNVIRKYLSSTFLRLLFWTFLPSNI
jgi:hypothetical protein